MLLDGVVRSGQRALSLAFVLRPWRRSDPRAGEGRGNWRLASARALPSLPGLARAVLWTVERLPARHSTTFFDGH
jgi:hypothetical protein